MDQISFDYHEQYLTAYCLMYPELISLFDVNIISYESYSYILNLIKQNNISKERILPSTIANWTQSDKHFATFMKIDTDSLYHLIERIGSLGFETAKRDIQSIIKRLMQNDSINDVCMILEKSIQLIRNDQVEKGINLAKSINYSNSNEVYTGMMAIIESCKVDNPAIPTGIKRIDNAIGGLTRGNLVHIIGDTGSMKTMITFWLLIQMLKQNKNLHGVYFEKEMPVKDLSFRMLSFELQVNLDILMKTNDIGKYVTMFRDKINNDKELLDLYDRLHIVSYENFSDAYDMRLIMEEYKPDIWVLDFFTMLENKKNKEAYTFAKDQGDTLKAIANHTNSIGIILSQTKQNTVEDRSNKIPRKSDAEYGSKINQFCQMNFATFFPFNYYPKGHLGLDEKYFYLIPLKSRTTGTAKLLNICMEAYPAQCFFEEAKGDTDKKMLEWINKYKYQKER